MTHHPIAITLIGAAGRMGIETARAAKSAEDLFIHAAVEQKESPALGQDLGKLAGLGDSKVIIIDNLDDGLEGSGVAIDFSSKDAAICVAEAAMKKKVPLICATTGLETEAVAMLKRAAKDIPVLHTPNLSLGVAVLHKLVEQALRSLGSGFDIEIVEMHHRDKLDSPSGTALALANTASRALGVNTEEALRFGRHGKTEKRGKSEIGIHAVRGGGIFGQHQVIIAGKHETIEIHHNASSRALFAEGALRAARFIYKRTPGMYTMENVLS